ncbi:MAG TPA: aminotransferase class IV [Cytophagales bacterium]|nr:aminotransferase class IV [Cytophagales bacterium]
MNVIFNGNLINDNDQSIGIENRAFLYGDGLFETMICENDNVLFIEDHLERLHRGMGVMKINIPDSLTIASIKTQIKLLLETNYIEQSARVKLIVWRKPGGLFCPTSNEPDFLITCKKHSPLIYSERKVDFSNDITLSRTIYSEFKRCSSLPYVLAGIEMKERKLDDIILLDNEGNVAECLYSNIFWLKEKTYYTPSLDTGCIAGIRRKFMLKKIKESDMEIEIVKSKPAALLESDHVFATNVAGIYPITQIRGKVYKSFIPTF